MKLISKDPGYIDYSDTSSNFDPKILELRLQSNIRDNSIFNYDAVRSLFKNKQTLKRINFDKPDWSSGSRFDRFNMEEQYSLNQMEYNASNIGKFVIDRP